MKILVVSGASGGHIYPALGFLETLMERQKNIETLLVLPRPSVKQIEIAGQRVRFISIQNISLSINLKNLMGLLKYIRGSMESLMIIFEFRPDIVVGFGSLASVPLLAFAWFLRIRTLIHEQNVVPGRANKLLARFCDRVAISFGQTKEYLRCSPKKVVFTGNPLRVTLVKMEKGAALRFFDFREDRFTILVMGGSQGSHKVNDCFVKTVSELPGREKLQVIHLAGSKDYASLDAYYRKSGLNFRLFDFFKDMQYAYSAADLVISRAGATTISEIIFFALAAIIIPYPFAYRHQANNAKVLEENGVALVIDEEKLDTATLKEALQGILSDAGILKTMRSNYNKIYRPDANNLFLENVLALGRN